MLISSPEPRTNELRELMQELRAVRWEMLALETRFAGRLDRLPKAQRGSANNLIHHLALRGRRALELRGRLEAMGVSLQCVMLNKGDYVLPANTAPSQPQEPGPSGAVKHGLMLPRPALAAGV